MHPSKLKDVLRRLVLATAICVGLALGGCPSYKVTGFELVPGSTKPGACSLAFRVEVTVPEAEPDAEPDSLEGRGLIGVWLPEGWEATELRMKAPGQDEHAALAQRPDLSPALPRTFPYAPGAWWPFVTDCLEIGGGVHAFEFEVDASGPADETRVSAGIAIELFDTEAQVYVVDSEVTVDLAQGTAVEVVAPGRYSEEVKSQLESCMEPVPDSGGEEDPCDCPKCPPQVDRGKRGCSCGAIGSPDHPRGLIGLIASTF